MSDLEKAIELLADAHDYDFRPDRVAKMCEADVDHELCNVIGNPAHPYCNAQDRRHQDAVPFVMALYERKFAIQARQRQSLEEQESNLIVRERERRRKRARQARDRLVRLGFSRVEIPDDPQEYLIEVWERDALIAQGKFYQVVPELAGELYHLGLDQNRALQLIMPMLRTAARMSGEFTNCEPRQSALDLNPSIRDLATEAAFGLQRIIAQRLDKQYRRSKARAADHK